MSTRQVTVVSTPVYRTTVLGGGSQGPAGRPGLSQSSPAISFAFGDATPAPAAMVLAGQRIAAIGVAIDRPFDGVGAAISVGTVDNPSLLLGLGIDVSVAATYALAPQAVFAVDTPIFLFITAGAGASQGSGALFIQTF